MRRMLGMMAALFCALTASLAAQATETGADLLRGHLYAGTSAEGQAELAARAQEGDAEAGFGAGLTRFIAGIEDLAQAFNRHGFEPERAMERSPMFSVVPPTEEGATGPVEPLDYAQMRDYLEAFVEAMDMAASQLLDASADADFSVEIDVMRIRLDLDGDGVGSEDEAVGAMILGPAMMGAMTTGASVPQAVLDQEAVFAFDGSDAIWLAGYSTILAVQAEFMLAHDFSDFFEASWHLLFPRAGLPMQDHSARRTLFIDGETDTMIADLIAAIHTLNWPVAEPDRLAGVGERLSRITDLSRRHWQATLAETDDHLEFIPGPHQTPVYPDMEITEEMVEAWLETLDTIDLIVEGELLLPHWRFADRGFDLSRYFETAERTDAIMILTGYGALPFLSDGPIASAEDFAAANAVFGDSIWGYALWFN